MTKKIIVFFGILSVLALVALFAAGQMLHPLPMPEVVFFGSIAAIVVLLIGYGFGRKNDKK